MVEARAALAATEEMEEATAEAVQVEAREEGATEQAH